MERNIIDPTPARNSSPAKGNSGIEAPCFTGVSSRDVAEIVWPFSYVNDTVMASSPSAARNPSLGPHTGEHIEVVEESMTYPAKYPVSGPVSTSLYWILEPRVDIVTVLPSSPIVSIAYGLELKSGA